MKRRNFWYRSPARNSRPKDRIVFAGEHLSDYGAWMKGAVQSGLRAINEVVAASGSTSVARI